jgi:hypothetical protein
LHEYASESEIKVSAKNHHRKQQGEDTDRLVLADEDVKIIA